MLHQYSKKEESHYIRDLARIMKNGEGPFSKAYLVEQLHKMHKNKTVQELKLEVSLAIESDKHINKRFKRVEGGWDLKDRK
jgi:hypothetical protein